MQLREQRFGRSRYHTYSLPELIFRANLQQILFEESAIVFTMALFLYGNHKMLSLKRRTHMPKRSPIMP